MLYDEEDWFQISALNKFLFCRRLFALTQIEDQWADNIYTISGNMFHERAHDPSITDKRGGAVQKHAVRVFSPELGVSGECDVVEFVPDDSGIEINDMLGRWSVRPVEYKYGRADASQSDKVQLCCQAMCLEFMLCCRIDFGFLYYSDSRRRVRVDFDDDLRELVTKSLFEMHELYRRRYTPVVRKKKACQGCSLREICMPGLAKSGSVKNYMRKFLEEDNAAIT